MMNSIITKEDIEKVRSVSELGDWIDKKHSQISNRKDTIKSCRLRKGLFKEFIEESMPLNIFCQQYFDNNLNVQVKQTIGSQNYDAELINQPNAIFKYIEITQAHEGKDDFYRRWHLNEFGHANALGEVVQNKPIAKSKIKSEAIDHATIVHNETQRIDQAINKKIDKDYNDKTALVVVCDSTGLAFKDENDAYQLKAYLNNSFIGKLNNFCKVFIVSWNGALFIELK